MPYKGRIIDIDSKYLSDSDQDKVVPVLYGRDLLSTSMLFPPWNLQRKKNSSGGKGGGKGGGGGSDTFFASILFAVCLGEVTSICSIYESDNLVYATAGSGTAIDTGTEIKTDYGDLRFYKGTASQKIDSAIRSVLVFKSNEPQVYHSYDVPDFRHICYAVSDKWNLGSSTSHPNIRIEAFKECTKLKHDYDEAHAQDETPSVADDYMSGYDYAPPVILYEILKDFPAITKMFTNNPDIQIDCDSFKNAAYDCMTEGIYISVCIDDSLTLADAVANILKYCDGVVYIEDNKLKIRLPWKEARNRSYVSQKTFLKDDLIEEPEVSYQSDEWGITKVSFCDRALDYEETTEVLEHPEYEGVVGLDTKIEEFDFVFIKQRSVANVLTKRLSNVGVKPSVDLTINVLPESVSDLKIGDQINVNYDKYPGLINVLFRVNSIASAENGAEIQAVSECKDFFEFENTDILFIEQEKYLAMDRGYPYLYPKILAQDVNGFQGKYGKGLNAFLFVAESYYAGRANFIWAKIESSSWHPTNPDGDIGIQPAYQMFGTLSRVFYNATSHEYEIKVSLSVEEIQSIVDKEDINGENYYIVCSRYNADGTAACVPIIFQIKRPSVATNEFVCVPFTGKFYQFSVKESDIGSKLSRQFFLVSDSELQNCSVQIDKMLDKNRFAAAVYMDEGCYEKTPGYAAVFYEKESGTNNILTHVLNRLNDNTNDVSEHLVMWPDNDCIAVTTTLVVGQSDPEEEQIEYPRLVWDETAGNYYVQYTDVELSDDNKEFLTVFEHTDVSHKCGNYQELVTVVDNGNLLANHHQGYDSLIYVTVMHSGNTLTLPSLEGVAPGDSITIIVNAVGVVDYTKLVIASADSGRFLSRSNDNESVPINSITGSTFNVASGITTKLYCVLKNTMEKYWFVDTYSGTETGF